MRPPSILLPGLDGTGDLFTNLLGAASPEWPLRVMPLPDDRPRGYHELAESIVPRLPQEPFAIIAESFSGPLAVLLASRSRCVSAVVLCASFVRPPLPAWFAALPDVFWRRPPPTFAIQLFMTGGDRRLAGAVRDAIRKTKSAVLATRANASLTVNVSAELANLRQPVLYLRAARDRLVPGACGAEICKLQRRAELLNIDGPHLLLQARAKESWVRIATFLERLTVVREP
jgi:pimeloyl-[acyl-carrier protein] methyl ester esterase